MRIITIGLSPYTLTSKGKLHGKILDSLKQDHSVTGLVWGHDINYHIPDQDGKHFFSGTEIVPLVPVQFYDNGPRDIGMQVYEYLQAASPDIVITIGDVMEFVFMRSIRSLMMSSLKWLFVLTTSLSRLNDAFRDVLMDADAILSTSLSAKRMIEKIYPKPLEWDFVGADIREYAEKDTPFRVMANCKRASQDNLAMIMEITAKSGMPLYAHTNVYDPKSDYDAAVIKEMFDPQNLYISLPAKYVSTHDGISDIELDAEYAASDLFISIPVASATSMTVFEAMSRGCWPLMSKCGSNKDIARFLSKYLQDAGVDVEKSDFLVRTIPVMVPHGGYIYIPDPIDLRVKLDHAKWILSQMPEMRRRIYEFSKRNTTRKFINRLHGMLGRLLGAVPTLCVETV